MEKKEIKKPRHPKEPPEKEVKKNLISSERYKPFTRQPKEEFPVSQFKIPLPKTKPNTDYNFCCIYFDGTKWEKSKKKSQSKTQIKKRSDTHLKKHSEVSVHKLEKKIRKHSNEKKRDKSPTTKVSEQKLKYKRRSRHFISGPDYIKFCKKPVLVNREMQTDNTIINETNSSGEASSVNSEVLRKLEVHRKTLEAKYSEEKIKKLIEKIKNNPYINESLLRIFTQKKLKERRSNLSKQTFPLIEITSTETPANDSEESLEKKKVPVQEPLRTKMPHRKISERELNETKKHNHETKFEKNLRPPRPQIPRRIITEAERDTIKLQPEPVVFEPIPVTRPTIPRKKVTEPPPKESLIFLDVPPIPDTSNIPKNDDKLGKQSLEVSSVDLAVWKPTSTSNEEVEKEKDVDLSEIFLKLLKKKANETETKAQNKQHVDCSIQVKEDNAPSKTDKGTNVPSCSNVKVELKTTKKLASKEERKVKTLWTLRNPRLKRPTADSLKNRTLKILSNQRMLKKQSQITTEQSLTLSTRDDKIIINCANPCQIKDDDKMRTTSRTEEINKRIHSFFTKREQRETSHTTAETNTNDKELSSKPKVNMDFLRRNSQSADYLKAKTCPSMSNSKTNCKTVPPISKSILSKVMKSKSINNINGPGRSYAPESSISTKTEKKWAAGSIYNSTLLFTKVNKDSNKESSFKKRKEYYKMLRTKQKPSISTKCFSNSQKFNKVSSQKCPLSKNIYYSRIETFPKRKNFYHNINFSTCLNVELDLLNCHNKKQAETGEKENEKKNQGDNNKIDMLVPAHSLKSDSDCENTDFEGNFSYCSVESGIQSYATSVEMKKSNPDFKKSKSDDKHKKVQKSNSKKNPLKATSSKAYTVASCMISANTNPNALLNDIININEDLFSNDYILNKYYSESDRGTSNQSYIPTSAGYSEDSGIEEDLKGRRKRKPKFWHKLTKLFKRNN